MTKRKVDRAPWQAEYSSSLMWRLLRAYACREVAIALTENNHNRTHTARALGISRRTLTHRLVDAKMSTRGTVRAIATETDMQLRLRVFSTMVTAARAPEDVLEEMAAES